MKVALVVIAIGDKYLEHYNNIFRPSHEAYAIKCGYHFRVITDYLDPALAHKDAITFNKILVCSQPWSDEYDYIIVIDADILINPNAPSLHLEYTYCNKIGIVDEYSQPTSTIRIEMEKLNNTNYNSGGDYYYDVLKKYIKTDKTFNTGVMIFQPLKHRDFLEYVYNKYSSYVVGHRCAYHFEQASIGYELQLANNYIILDNKWNAIWLLESSLNINNTIDLYVLDRFSSKNYFIHFVGGMFHEFISGINFNVLIKQRVINDSIIIEPPCNTFGDTFSIIGMIYFMLEYYNKVYLHVSDYNCFYFDTYFSKSCYYNKRIFVLSNITSLMYSSPCNSIHVCDMITNKWEAPSVLLTSYDAVDKTYYYNDANPFYKHLMIDQKYICMPNTHLPPTEMETNHLVYYKLVGLNNSVRMDFFDYTRDIEKEKSVTEEVLKRYGVANGEKYNIINTAGDTSDMKFFLGCIKNNYKCIDIHNLMAFPGWALSLIENAESIHLVEGSNVNFIYHCQYKKIVNITKPVYFHVWARDREFCSSYKLYNAWTMMTEPRLENWVFLMTRENAAAI